MSTSEPVAKRAPLRAEGETLVRTALWIAAALTAVLGVVLVATGAGAGLTLLTGIAVGGLIVAAQRSGGPS